MALRQVGVDDAGFILRLLNEPSWLRFIGDKGVRTLEDARAYIVQGPLEMYRRYGHGLYLTELRGGGPPIGLCGLLKRETLPDVDIGFAFLPEFWGQGYGYESASAVMAYGRSALGLRRMVAITDPANASSIRLLEKLGLRFERMVKLSGDGQELQLLAWEL